MLENIRQTEYAVRDGNYHGLKLRFSTVKQFVEAPWWFFVISFRVTRNDLEPDGYVQLVEESFQVKDDNFHSHLWSIKFRENTNINYS